MDKLNLIGDYMTPDELAKEFVKTGAYGRLKDLSSKGGPTIERQHEINRVWLNTQFSMLKLGGFWAWPESRRMFKKVDAYYFREVGTPEA
jgi:hypothetical protein